MWAILLCESMVKDRRMLANESQQVFLNKYCKALFLRSVGVIGDWGRDVFTCLLK